MNADQVLRKAMNKTGLYLHKNASTILTCIGAVGVIATTVTAVTATPKAMKLLEAAKHEKGEELTKLEVVQTAAPVYIPSVVIGAATIGCMFSANVLNKEKQASITSAYALLDNYHKRYRGKLIELHGKEADIEIRDAMARECCSFHQIGLDAPDEKVIFYDEISGESITCYEREIMDAEYHLNRNFTMRGYASLNEFYEFLGLPQTEYGDELGWSMSYGYSWIDFEHRLISRDDGGRSVYSIDMVFAPDADYLEDWM